MKKVISGKKGPLEGVAGRVFCKCYEEKLGGVQGEQERRELRRSWGNCSDIKGAHKGHEDGKRWAVMVRQLYPTPGS